MAQPAASAPLVPSSREVNAAAQRAAASRRMLVALAAYASILTALAGILNTWTDEEYTLATTAHGLVYAWQRAFSYELQAPLYFGIMALWREANASVWFARFFSVLCATGFFAILFPIGRRVAPERDPLPFAAILACNPFVVWAALEIRLYAFALLISALLWLTVDEGFAHGSSRAARIAFVALGIVALYTQYFLGFLFIAYAVTLVVERRRRAVVPYVLALAAIAVATLPLFAALHAQVAQSDLSSEPVTALLHDTFVHPWLEFVMPYDRLWDQFRGRAVYATLLVVLVALVVYARPKLSIRLGGTLAAALAVEVIYLLAVAVLRLGLQPRHFVALFLPLLVAAYGLVLSLARSRHPRVATWLVAANIALATAALVTTYGALAKNGDSKRIGGFLTIHARPTDVIAIYPADALPAYRRDYAGSAPLVQFPHGLRTDRYDIAGLTVSSEFQAAAAVRRLERSHARVWLVVQGDCDEKRPVYGCDHVLSAVRATRVRSDSRFFKGRVFELDGRS